MSHLISKTSGSFQSFDGTRIYYESRGSGQPIVLNYGLACLMNHWHFQIEHLSKKFQVITFDMRGHHSSETPIDIENLTLTGIAKDIPALLREVGIKKAHFVGHSLGGQVLLKTYELFPELFKSVTFINGFAKNPIKGMFGLDVVEPFFYFIKENYKKNPELFDRIWKTAVDNPITAIGSALAGGFNLRLTQMKDIEIYVKGVSNMPLSTFIPLFEDMMHFQGDLIAPTVSVPTLIISGERDSVTPKKFQEDLHHSIKHSEYIRVPYGSHDTQLDFPEYVNLTLENFFNRYL